MKKKGWSVIAGIAAYDLLFFRQDAGINFLIFTVLLLALFNWNTALLKQRNRLFFACTAVLSGIFVMLTGSSLAILANITALLLLSSVCFNYKASVFINFLNGIYSVVIAVVCMAQEVFYPHSDNKENGKKNGFNALLVILTVIIILVFFVIYKKANPLFDKYTADLNFNFLDPEWILFTIGGTILMYGAFKHSRIDGLDAWESSQPIKLENTRGKSFNKNEKNALLFLFTALNIMLVFINALDVNYLYLGAGLPDGITHKQFVHDGVNMLILSIVIGISIILYAFRGSLNFDNTNRFVKLLIYTWLAQNILMVFSTAMRNHLYIVEALLTYKRIGVYYWLFFAVAGLITTFIKIRQIKPNWDLVRINSFIAYIVLISSAAIDWDQVLSEYNISHTHNNVAGLDKKYLLSVSEGNIKQLFELRNTAAFETDSIYHYQYRMKYSNTKRLDRKLFYFLADNQNNDWRSFNFRRNRVMADIKMMDKAGMIDSLNLYDAIVKSTEPLQQLNNLKEIKLPAFFDLNSKTVAELKQLQSLETLWFDKISASEVIYIFQLSHLQKIYIEMTDADLDKLFPTHRPKNLVAIN